MTTRPALEMLFARAAQGRVFLLLMAGGLLLGLLLTAAGALYRWSRVAGMVADLLCALAAAGLVMTAAFLAGDGLRLYGLLGLAVGVLLYRCGVQPAAAGVLRLCWRLFGR